MPHAASAHRQANSSGPIVARAPVRACRPRDPDGSGEANGQYWSGEQSTWTDGSHSVDGLLSRGCSLGSASGAPDGRRPVRDGARVHGAQQESDAAAATERDSA